MAFIYEYGLFLAKAATLVLAVAIIIALIAGVALKQRPRKGQLEIHDLNEAYLQQQELLQHYLLPKKAFKKWQKNAQKSYDQLTEQPKRLFVVEFNGSIDAHEAEALREEVSAILAVATTEDEVLLKLESGGGVVHGYGLAASQLDRLKQQQIPLTVAVDKVAASGGYMMACVADKILAAPFAIIGSIGVIAQLPNFNRLLKKHDVDFEQFTAGEFKRTVTLFGENTDKGRQKFQQELEETHQLFKAFVVRHRPALTLDKVATGEHWFGYQALELGLIDELSTSDSYLSQACQQRQVLQVKYSQKKRLSEKLGTAGASFGAALWQKLQQWRWH
ncbi:putative inner membrane peptidase [Alishewanella aestuarii B11]|uniref:Putative inner membrane peptidase n=1 Tax=Alishewanella aestuarii B11 TaxID=1197174 RepID=J1Y8K3_9ALTE|nr:protease SohB [Alishewanella aestuarii]EJI84065.1 putative inner membrane peptidase [Alishewanella aestuarii B11]